MLLRVPGLDFSSLGVLTSGGDPPGPTAIFERLRAHGPGKRDGTPKKCLQYVGIYIKIHQYFVSLLHPLGRCSGLKVRFFI